MYYDLETGVRERNGLFPLGVIIFLAVVVVAIVLYLVVSGEIYTVFG